MKTPEVATPVETAKDVIALRLKQQSPTQDYDDYVRYINDFADFILENNLNRGLHFESGAFLFDEKDAELIRQHFEVDDVTAVYRELEERTSGFRIVCVGSSRTMHYGNKSYTNKAAVIKDYGTGILCVYDESGRPYEDIIPKEAASAAFSPSRFETVTEEPLRFFDSLEEALVSRNK